MFNFFKTKTETIDEQEKLREIDMLIFDLFLKEKKEKKENKIQEKLDKKKTKSIVKDLKKFAESKN
jgi:hypothetical protein